MNTRASQSAGWKCAATAMLLFAAAALSPAHAQAASAATRLSPFAPLSVSGQENQASDFTLASQQKAAPIFVDAQDFPVVRIAADALAADVERVASVKPTVSAAAPQSAASAVFIGTAGSSPLIDRLIQSGKVDVSAIRGARERYVIATVSDPVPGIAKALVIVGSDRRGTAFGVFDVSASIGVSPWVWWADVVPAKRSAIVLSDAAFTSPGPSVQYRGIFINDEDWSFLPWSKRLDPQVNNIGPKSYALIGELLLRLKANALWPAMHGGTTSFYQLPENRQVMDRYAIVMGSSHSEAMLFNNASEWKYPGDYWNYDQHADLIRGAWENRLKQAGAYENAYTLGLRGIHDTPMQGAPGIPAGVNRLEKVFADQRSLISQYVSPNVTGVPQIFVPYKEVLPIYQAGLKVPDDATLVWVDDNYGYIRQLSNAQERQRSGGAGVYYHFSYWGPPQDYLWLGSTSPALTAYEMGKAYAFDARRMWMFNVGGVKPREKEMEFALRLAWDVKRYPANRAMGFLRDFAVENFGEGPADQIASILQDYYHLTARVKPEHSNRMSLAPSESSARQALYRSLATRVDDLHSRLPVVNRDAFFQLVLYPVKAAALMNEKYTAMMAGDMSAAGAAHDAIQSLTATYNTGIAGGKWNGMIDASPKNDFVFRRPGDIGASGRVGTPIAMLAAANASARGNMRLVGDALVSSASTTLPDGSGSDAAFAFDAPAAGATDVYFLIRTPDDKSDSWYVDLNGQKTVINNNVTGIGAAWVKVWTGNLHAGANRLTLGEREPGAAIYRVALMAPGEVPPPVQIASLPRAASGVPEPLAVIPAASYAQASESSASRWTRVDGLGIERSAMTLMPYASQSIAQPENAPSLTYAFSANVPQIDLEARFLPTHGVNQGMGLRYAVSVDGGPMQVRNIDSSAETSADWNQNVLAGYARGTTSHAISAGQSQHSVTIRLLDPGMVLSQIRVSKH